MLKWLLKNTAEYRVETMVDVEEFHKILQKEAEDGDFTLCNFSWTKKERKQGGELVDEWFVVKCSFLFNDQKDPEKPFTKVEFPRYNEE